MVSSQVASASTLKESRGSAINPFYKQESHVHVASDTCESARELIIILENASRLAYAILWPSISQRWKQLWHFMATKPHSESRFQQTIIVFVADLLFYLFFVLSRPVNPYPANHDHGLLLAFTPESSQLHLSTPLLSSQQSPPPLISPTRSSDHDDVESSVESWIFLAHSQLPAGTIFTCFSFSLFFHTSHRSFLILSDGPIS